MPSVRERFAKFPARESQTLGITARDLGDARVTRAWNRARKRQYLGMTHTDLLRLFPHTPGLYLAFAICVNNVLYRAWLRALGRTIRSDSSEAQSVLLNGGEWGDGLSSRGGFGPCDVGLAEPQGGTKVSLSPFRCADVCPPQRPGVPGLGRCAGVNPQQKVTITRLCCWDFLLSCCGGW